MVGSWPIKEGWNRWATKPEK
ncbi:uncharacterized protein G2W53_024417 [Senna tora]|uniref:Uncharacterized protein n=1 Tax=Senna tora TaxID=362788 RepID=A0A834WDW1_9FABA|nr:uncharacterized protein G2W53_024417 [Senna tora]